MSQLIKNLTEKGYLRTSRIIDAFANINRVEFVPESLTHNADADIPLPIGYGQTISQPLVVAFILELLEVKEGQNVLDVGSGSGWTTALLAYIVGPKGHVTGLEIVPALYRFGKANIAKFKMFETYAIELHNTNGREGYEENAPYDRILVSASAEEVPQALADQLAPGGKMVIPIRNAIWLVEKDTQGKIHTEPFEGFSFVPLMSETPV